MTSNPTTSGIKRAYEDVIVDPVTHMRIEDAKKPRIDLDAARKYKCMKSIVEAYYSILSKVFGPTTKGKGRDKHQMDVDDDRDQLHVDAQRNITVGNHIVSIIFTIHNVCRQEVKNTSTNMIKKTATTSFNIHFRGNDYLVDNKFIKDKWVEILKGNGLEYKGIKIFLPLMNGLEYKDFSTTDNTNWYGTMGSYVDMFAAYALRINELRLGHNNMPITKQDGVHKSFPVSKYGLSGAHHVLLEGTSFPPERRSSIVQSLGAMTAWLCMLRSDGIYRKKYAAAVKRAMSHVPCIDDLIHSLKQQNKHLNFQL